MPEGGTLSITTDGCYTFSTSNGDFEYLSAGETAESCFTYLVCDIVGASASAEVCIEITGANDPPAAEDDSYLLSTEDPTVRANIIEPNDSDPEADKLTVLALDGDTVGSQLFEKTLASGGVIKVDPLTGDMSYDGGAYVDGLGQDERFVETVPYSISDGNGGTDMATITFIVPGKNDPPVAEDDGETVPEGEEVSDCILTNDSDPDGDKLEVCEVKSVDGTTTFSFNTPTKLPGGGILIISADGCYTFSTSNGDFEYLDSGETAESCFKYWACDEYGESAEAEVCIEIYGESTPSSHPSSLPSSSPSSLPSSQPSSSPSSEPSKVPSSGPSSSPTSEPSSDPSSQPNSSPSSSPSGQPSSSPSSEPSKVPSSGPSSSPSSEPSSLPSSQPSSSPSSEPSKVPSSDPSSDPSSQPSSLPSSDPSSDPSSEPSSQPSSDPSSSPSSEPSSQPSSDPSSDPSSEPSSQPSSDPSSSPSSEP